MPSPFPDMAPYIEGRDIWSDFHAGLADEIRATLNAIIQPHYVARMTPYVTYDVVEVARTRGIRPDVSVWQSPATGEAGGVVAPVIEPAPVESLVPLEFPLRLQSVEIRTAGDMLLVTAIEILSPVNKRSSHEAYTDYLHKRRELLRSQAHLIEIDLLRGGTRPPLERDVPPAPYYAMVSRVEDRPTVQVWPIQLFEALPVLSVPLLEPDPDVSLDLGAVIFRVYERGGYASTIDYQQPPPPPSLSRSDSTWLYKHLKQKGIRIAAENDSG